MVVRDHGRPARRGVCAVAAIKASGLERRARRENAGCYGQWIDQYSLAKPGVRLVVFVIE
jgi:hypothetical protein